MSENNLNNTDKDINEEPLSDNVERELSESSDRSQAETEKVTVKTDNTTNDDEGYFDKKFSWKASGEEVANEKKARKDKKISLRVFILALVATLVVCATLSFNISEHLFNKRLEEAKSDIYETVLGTDQIQLVQQITFIEDIFSVFGYTEYEKEAAIDAMLKGYVDGTGDKYAEYYTKEELEALFKEDSGELVGIGVSVTYDTEYNAIYVIEVYDNSPAMESDIRPGDLITHVVVDGKRESVASMGYEMSLEKVKGDEGTFVELTVARGDETKESIDFKIERRKVQTYTATGKVCDTDSKVGIVRITSFDYKTPLQFKEAMESLKSKGCEKFVLDVRNNPGGLVISVEAVLSFFLNEGDNIIYTEDKAGNGSWSTVKEVNYNDERYNACNVSKEDIGRYRDLDIVVLANENTASAGELLTATLKEYGLAKVIGVNTYGKGSYQTTYDLTRFGLSGGIKLTTHMYAPMSKINYDGVGIKPDIEVEIAEEYKNVSLFRIPHADDNQLQTAISVLYGN